MRRRNVGREGSRDPEGGRGRFTKRSGTNAPALQRLVRFGGVIGGGRNGVGIAYICACMIHMYKKLERAGSSIDGRRRDSGEEGGVEEGQFCFS